MTCKHTKIRDLNKYRFDAENKVFYRAMFCSSCKEVFYEKYEYIGLFEKEKPL